MELGEKENVRIFGLGYDHLFVFIFKVKFFFSFVLPVLRNTRIVSCGAFSIPVKILGFDYYCFSFVFVGNNTLYSNIDKSSS